MAELRSVVLAGGGTGGHIYPLLAFADCLRQHQPTLRITCVGSTKGLEGQLIPAAGYELRQVPAYQLPRSVNLDLAKTPARMLRAMKVGRAVLDDVDADVVVGFGGYVSVPAYLAAWRRHTPLVIHEVNVPPGVANRLGMRFTKHVAVGFPHQPGASSMLADARVTGVPLRPAISTLNRAESRIGAREHFGLHPHRPTLFVFGASQGARSINQAMAGAAKAITAAGVQVLHVTGARNEGIEIPPDLAVPYVTVPYIADMELGYAAADLVLSRGGALTLAEVTTVGLPAIYVPLPYGNGEQRRNALPVVQAGGGLLVDDAELTPQWIERVVVPLAKDELRLAEMSAAASRFGRRDGDEALRAFVLDVVAGEAVTETEVPLSAEDLGHVHLIGVGGVGMSGLARLLLTRGIPTSGSELKDWPSLAGLKALGGTIYMRHEASNLDGVDTVVFSSAIPADHLELVEARARGLRVLHRSEALAAAMTGRQTIAVAGTHGKTTTTSMITSILQHGGLDPSFVIGGEIAEAGSNAHHGTGEHFVAEADEHDRSFLNYRPQVAIVTNIDADHLNTYGDLSGLEDAFLEFCRLVGPTGSVVLCADDAPTRRLADRARAEGLRVETYGEAADATLHLADLRSTATSVRYLAFLDGQALGEFSLPVPGRHLGLNSAAAVLTSLRLGLPVHQVADALAAFPGVRRRFELKGVVDGVRVYDEYAYHPTAMTAALETLREVAGDGRLLVVFQPYRVYRTRDLRAEIAAALAIADEVVVMEVFGPGEAREPGDGGIALTATIALPPDRKAFVASWEDVAGEVVARARPGDVVVTMGAPPISLMGDELLAALAARTR